MDDARVGRAVKVMRVRRGWRQDELAVAAGVSRQLVSKIECGRLSSVQVGTVRGIAQALGCRLELLLDSPGQDLQRLLNARHSAMHEAAARLFRRIGGWLTAPEVSFSIYGERGVIDVLAFHPATRALLVIELKTAVVDVNDLLATMDRRRRLAPRIATERGWAAGPVSAWVLVAESATNRRRVAAHATVLRGAYPLDGRSMQRWLAAPTGPVAALSFLADASPGGTSRGVAPVRHPRRAAPVARRPSPATLGGT